MKFPALAAATAALALAAPAMAQTDNSWTGFYAGVSAGWDFQPSDNDETINFDTNLDGNFTDTVRTAAGANAFSPGFCGGKAVGVTPGNCQGDQDSLRLMGHIGFDYDLGGVVIGAVAEGGVGFAEDYVSAYSTTPAFYTMTRQVREQANARLRAGYAFGENRDTLVYGTGGVAWGKVTNRFRSSNTGNARQSNGNSDGWGYTAGGGIEHRVTPHLSLGVRYLYTELDADDGIVRLSRGTQPATNPFILTNAGGTDFLRSHSKFATHNVSATISYRF